jgi:Holliday junction resolvase-like predicted endonuclease
MKVEESARIYLSSQPGMIFFEKNYHAYTGRKRGEIDLIFLESTANAQWELVFIEVRSRKSGESWETAEESLSGLKRRYLKTAMELFLWRESHRLPSNLTAMRFDFLAWDGVSWNWTKDVRF